MKNIILTGVVVAALLFGIFALAYTVPKEKNDNKKSPPQTEQAEQEEKKTPDFIESGVAAKGLPGLKENEIYLIYEKPGRAAITVMLKIQANSLCGTRTSKIECYALSVSDYGLINGRKITVKGTLEGNVVFVKEIEMEPLE